MKITTKKIYVLTSIIISLISLLLTPPALAASEDECSIWLCLPGGFPNGCAAAHAAMVKRVSKLKSPLPDFSSCVVNPPEGSADMKAKDGYAAYIPSKYNSYTKTTTPASYIRGKICARLTGDKFKTPKGCVSTVRWAEVYLDGNQTGPTYYW